MTTVIVHPDTPNEEHAQLVDILDEFWHYVQRGGAVNIVWPSTEKKYHHPNHLVRLS